MSASRSDADASISYGSYLALDELLTLQRPRAEPEHPDELLFIVVHQASELWFKCMLHEIEHLTAELGQIMQAVEKVSEVATPDVPSTSHPIPMQNVFRDDVVAETLTTEQALAGAPEADGSRFVVSAILGEEQ